MSMTLLLRAFAQVQSNSLRRRSTTIATYTLRNRPRPPVPKVTTLTCTQPRHFHRTLPPYHPVPTPTNMAQNPGGRLEDWVTPTKPPAPPSPSASIILVSPTNTILLTHRVQTSRAFPSAHVFPGGNLSPSDGHVPTTGKERHIENDAYRVGAIRELFEETGILLAKTSPADATLLELSEEERARGRRSVHGEKVDFRQWLAERSKDAVLDTAGLIPFSHWMTPPNVPKRFSTQMYLYFVPVAEEGNASVQPTSDRLENTEAVFRRAGEWVELSRRGEIILFPPQFLLLSLVGGWLDGGGEGSVEGRREGLRAFVEREGWGEKYISPLSLGHDILGDGRTVLGIDKPGLELVGSGLSGDKERVVLVSFRKEGPRKVDWGWRREVMEQVRKRKGGGEVKEPERRYAPDDDGEVAKGKESKL